jgi:hypothetical protein
MRARGRLDLLHELCQLVGGLLHGQDLHFEMLDASRALAQLGHELRDAIGERDSICEPALLRARGTQLLFERGHIGLAFRKLRIDLSTDLSEHLVEYAFGQDVTCSMTCADAWLEADAELGSK